MGGVSATPNGQIAGSACCAICAITTPRCMCKAYMVKEIALDRIEAYADFLRGPHIELAVQSAAAGNSAAQLWEIGQPHSQSVVLLWDQGNNVLYLCGELVAASAQHELADLIHTGIRPRSIQQGMTYFKVRALTPSIQNVLEVLFHSIALRELPT